MTASALSAVALDASPVVSPRAVSKVYAATLALWGVDLKLMLRALGVKSSIRRPCRELSAGTVRRVAIARALAAAPEAPLLDEPFAGLLLAPGLALHPQAIALPAIVAGPTSDLYVTALDMGPTTDTATLRVGLHPLTSWLWPAGGLIALGGVLSLRPRWRPAARPARAAAVAANPVTTDV